MSFFSNYNQNNLIKYTVDTAFDSNLSIYVQNGEVVVSAPSYLSRRQIQEAVMEKKAWILNKLKDYEITKELNAKKLNNINRNYTINKSNNINKNNTFSNIILLGKSYPINITYKHIKFPEVNFMLSNIEIILPTGYKNKDIKKIMNLIINKIYLSIANQKIDIIMEKVRLMMDFAPENFDIKSQKSTLGMCVPNNTIIFSLELFKYNPRIIEYIVIHEFCHLKYKNHTKSFYNMLKKYVPNYEDFDMELINYQC